MCLNFILHGEQAQKVSTLGGLGSPSLLVATAASPDLEEVEAVLRGAAER